MILEDYIKTHAAQTPDKEAIRTADQSITYAELWQKVKVRATEYMMADRQAIVFQATATIGTLVTYFAAHLARVAAVPLDKNLDQRILEGFDSRLKKTPPPSGVADILFTTGTTGEPKGVMIGHEAIIANAENLIDAQGYSAETEFIINGPLNHIGSLSKVWPTILMGGTIVLVDGLRDLAAFFEAFDKAKGDKVATFLVPAAINIVLKFGEGKLSDLSNKIDFIETGAAPIGYRPILKLHQALPYSRLFNTYASTETGIISTFNFNEYGCLIPRCLGKTMKHSKLTILEDTRVMCSGPTLMMGYYDDPELTASVLKDGNLTTGDVAHFDDKGRLFLDGRFDCIININGFKVNPEEVERVAMSTGCVKDCICVSAKDENGIGNHLKLIVVLAGNLVDITYTLRPALMLNLEPYKVPNSYETTDKIARTFNGKLDRKAYRE